MWGKNSSSSFQAGTGETTYIAADCEFTGKLTLKGNARIDGQIEGTLNVHGDLVIGPSAVLKATIEANSVSISGVVHGEIIAQDSLELCSSARLYGDIHTKQLKIDQGAQFIGTSRLLGEATEANSKEIIAFPLKNTEENTVDSSNSPENHPQERPAKAKRR